MKAALPEIQECCDRATRLLRDAGFGSASSKVQGMADAIRSFVDYLYAFAAA